MDISRREIALIDKRWQTSVKLCRAFRGADESSNHNLVLCNLKLKLRYIPNKQHKRKRNIQVLETLEESGQYEAEIAKRIKDAEMEQLDMKRKVATLDVIIKQTVEATVPLEEQPKKKCIGEQTLELAEEKRKLRLKT